MKRSRQPLQIIVVLAMGIWMHGASGAEAPVFITPKLEILNKQIEMNGEDAQAYANRGYTLALLGRKDDARADITKSVTLKDNGPMHNRAGWAYFNMGEYADAVREFEAAVKLSGF